MGIDIYKEGTKKGIRFNIVRKGSVTIEDLWILDIPVLKKALEHNNLRGDGDDELNPLRRSIIRDVIKTRTEPVKIIKQDDNWYL